MSEESEEYIPISCGSIQAKLVLTKFICPGIHQECIDVDGVHMTPKAFCILGEKAKLKDWKNAIRINGRPIRRRMDMGDIDFYKHDEICSGRCMSRNTTPSKYDYKIENLRQANDKLSSDSEWPSPFTFTQGIDEPAYNILREVQAGSPTVTNATGKIIFPEQMISDIPPGTSIDSTTIKTEPMSDPENADVKSSVNINNNNTHSVEVNGRALKTARHRRKSAVPKHVSSNGVAQPVPRTARRRGRDDGDATQSKIIKLVAEYPDTESLLEDSVGFWHSVRDLGILDDVIRDVKHSMDVLKHDMSKEKIQEADARRLSGVVSELGLVTKLKWRLAEHHTRTENEKELLLKEIAALKKKVAESEEKQKVLKRKSDRFESLFDVSRPKQQPTSSSSVSGSPTAELSTETSEMSGSDTDDQNSSGGDRDQET